MKQNELTDMGKTNKTLCYTNKKLMPYLHCLCLFVSSVFKHILYCVFVFFFFFFCDLCSVDCPFLIAHLVFSNVYLAGI